VENYTVWRYPIKLTSKIARAQKSVMLKVPTGAKLLSVGLTPWQYNAVQLWFMVNSEVTSTTFVEVLIMETGVAMVSKEMMERLTFVGTVTTVAKKVYHVFTVCTEERI